MLKNDTNGDFDADSFFSGVDNGTGADYTSWNSGWTRN